MDKTVQELRESLVRIAIVSRFERVSTESAISSIAGGIEIRYTIGRIHDNVIENVPISNLVNRRRWPRACET